MIKTFKHKGLKRFFELGVTAQIQHKHAPRLRLILGMLNAISKPLDMTAPGLNFHSLKGERKDSHAVSVSGNWRITFRMNNSDVIDVNYEDYH